LSSASAPSAYLNLYVYVSFLRLPRVACVAVVARGVWVWPCVACGRVWRVAVVRVVGAGSWGLALVLALGAGARSDGSGAGEAEPLCTVTVTL